MFWIMALLCLQFSVTPGAYFLALSGSMLLLANTVWALLSPALKSRPPVVLLGSASLKLGLGSAFYLCLFTGSEIIEKLTAGLNLNWKTNSRHLGGGAGGGAAPV